MSLRFTVLASGSGGNASLVQVGDFGLLIDIGLSPTVLGERLAARGLSADGIHAVLLTHTHSDHWNGPALTWLRKRQIPLYCNPAHHGVLATYGEAFNKMQQAGLIRPFEAGEIVSIGLSLRALPVPVRHDSSATFAFRLEGPPDLFGRSAAVGYAADLGCWDGLLANALAGVDLLALEFN